MIKLASTEVSMDGIVIAVSMPTTTYLDGLLPAVGNNIFEYGDEGMQCFMRENIPVFFESDCPLQVEVILKSQAIKLTGYKLQQDRIVIIWRDLASERSKNEIKLDEQRKFYEDILNRIPADIAVIDTNKRYQYLNPSAVKDPEVRAWMIGKNDEEYATYRNKSLTMAKERMDLFEKAILTQTKQTITERYIDKNGEEEYQLRNYFPVLDENRAVKYLILYGVNVTERTKLQNELHLLNPSIKITKNLSNKLRFIQFICCFYDEVECLHPTCSREV